MSNKIFITVIALSTVAPFGYFTANHAIDVSHRLQEQNTRIEQLNIESTKLDKKIENSQKAKEQAEEEVNSLDKKARELAEERKKLEAELSL